MNKKVVTQEEYEKEVESEATNISFQPKMPTDTEEIDIPQGMNEMPIDEINEELNELPLEEQLTEPDEENTCDTIEFGATIDDIHIKDGKVKVLMVTGIHATTITKLATLNRNTCLEVSVTSKQQTLSL